jgi:hypothetical protein
LASVTLAAASVRPGAAQIRRVLDFREGGSYGDWSPNGRIVFKRDGDIWLAGPDPKRDTCVTCGNPGVVALRNTAPVWFPRLQKFLFRSGDGRVLIGDTARRIMRVPGIDSKAADFRFSRDGKMLAWTQRSQPPAGFLADVNGGTISGARRFQLPQELVFEAVDDFLAGAPELLVTASRRGDDPRFTEVYACSLTGRAKCRAITHKPREHDDYARVTPNGKRLLFASSDVGWSSADPVGFESDYWLLDLEPPGGLKRMTWFNEPANPNYIEQGVRAATTCWGPDGKWLLATLILDAGKNRTRLVKIEFPEVE